jgi:hypothetical protein
MPFSFFLFSLQIAELAQYYRSDLQLILDLFNGTNRIKQAAQRLLNRKYESKMHLDKTIEMVKEFFTTRD